MKKKLFTFVMFVSMVTINQTNAQLVINHQGGAILGHNNFDPAWSIAENSKLYVYGDAGIFGNASVNDDLTVSGTLKTLRITSTSSSPLLINSTTNFSNGINITGPTTINYGGNIKLNGYSSDNYTNISGSGATFQKNELNVQILGSYTLQVGGEVGNTNLYVNGKALSSGWLTSSDARLKKNIEKISDAKDLLMKLDGKTYNYKSKEELTNSLKRNDIDPLPQGKYYGVIAQELLEVVPELVYFDSVSKYYAVDYTGLIPILIEGFKEQNARIEALENELNVALTKSNVPSNYSKSAIEVLDIPQGLSLGDNIPNPFSIETTIEFYIPASVTYASFMVCDLQGKQMMSQKISTRESGSITISGTTLNPGIYQYSIIADGQLADTKQMVLTEN